MATAGLAQFERESFAARDEALELGRRGLADVAAFSYAEIVRESPTADPDQPGSGRLRASWTMQIGTANEEFAPLPPAGNKLAPPGPAAIRAVLEAVQLGHVIWIANGSPCVSTVNDRTSFVDQVIAATESKAEEIATRLSSRGVSGERALVRARGGD